MSVNYPSYGGNYELNNLSAINAPNLTEIVYNNAMGSMNPFGFDYRKLKSISVDNDELYSEDNIVYDRTDKNRCAFVFGNTIENAETKFKNITYFGPRRYNLDFPETETVKTFNRTIPVFTNTTLCCESKHLVFDNLIGVDSSQLFSNIATTPDLSVEFPNLLYINKRPSDEDQNEDAIYLYSGSLINVIGPIFNSCGISYVSVPNLITIPIWFIHSKGNPDKVNYGVKVIDFSKRKSDTLPNIRSSNVSIYSYFNGCNNNFEIWVPARLYDKWYADPKWSFVKDRLVAK